MTARSARRCAAGVKDLDRQRFDVHDRICRRCLQRDLGLTEEEAYLTIQRQSRQRRKTKKEIAEAIVLGEELRRGRS